MIGVGSLRFFFFFFHNHLFVTGTDGKIKMGKQGEEITPKTGEETKRAGRLPKAMAGPPDPAALAGQQNN